MLRKPEHMWFRSASLLHSQASLTSAFASEGVAIHMVRKCVLAPHEKNSLVSACGEAPLRPSKESQIEDGNRSYGAAESISYCYQQDHLCLLLEKPYLYYRRRERSLESSPFRLSVISAPWSRLFVLLFLRYHCPLHQRPVGRHPDVCYK